jgi:MFS family permease
MIAYREEKAEWKRLSRSSSLMRQTPSGQTNNSPIEGREKPTFMLDTSTTSSLHGETRSESLQSDQADSDAQDDRRTIASRIKDSKFRHIAAEVGFCFTIAMTQFLAEYLISGFALELPRLVQIQVGSGAMGLFWPASLLSLILSATLFIFARLSDMYSGYMIFMSGVAWLAIWTLIPGFCRSLLWIDISRAMQGLAIAAFMPSTFTMVGSIYPEGPRRNFVMGLYSGCAPLGFFAGFLTAGALPYDKPQWYFWIASTLSVTTLVTAYLSVPSDRTDRRRLGLKMDWIGAFLITSGLILVSYALAVEPYANQMQQDKTAWAFPIVSAPFASGIVCLCLAFWYEGWCATCPLLPFDFFKPRSVKAFSLACLCFYASYGVWLYNSVQYLQMPTVTTIAGQPGLQMPLWYLPTAAGGIILCVVGGSLMHLVPIMALLLVSALAWIAAPLLLALAPLPVHYWSFVLPSMLCATIGIDLTFTISIVFFSSVQPLRYQGLSGAVSSSLVNLAMSFALSISEIVKKQASQGVSDVMEGLVLEYRGAFFYGAASAGMGLLLCVLFVRISRKTVQQQHQDEEEQLGFTSSESTLVENVHEQHEDIVR